MRMPDHKRNGQIVGTHNGQQSISSIQKRNTKELHNPTSPTRQRFLCRTSQVARS
jgi:hypothetical protein